MTSDPKKLKAFADKHGGMYAQSSVLPIVAQDSAPWEDVIDESDDEEISEDLKDDMSEASQFKRKLDAGYMELSVPAGGFSCGTCKFALEGGACVHPSVRAPVDSEYGCCNFFSPAEASQQTFPPILKPSPLKDDEESDEDDEEEITYGP